MYSDLLKIMVFRAYPYCSEVKQSKTQHRHHTSPTLAYLFFRRKLLLYNDIACLYLTIRLLALNFYDS